MQLSLHCGGSIGKSLNLKQSEGKLIELKENELFHQMAESRHGRCKYQYEEFHAPIIETSCLNPRLKIRIDILKR